MKCNICDAYKNEKIIKENEDFFIVDAKTKKGHNKRFMVCRKAHVQHDPRDIYDLLDALEFVYDLFGEDFVIFNGIFASIKEHEHFIASDRHFEEEVVDITKEPRIEVFV
jgi:hypothetical protein